MCKVEILRLTNQAANSLGDMELTQHMAIN
jgi:hypothetical protein